MKVSDGHIVLDKPTFWSPCLAPPLSPSLPPPPFDSSLLFSLLSFLSLAPLNRLTMSLYSYRNIRKQSPELIVSLASLFIKPGPTPPTSYAARHHSKLKPTQSSSFPLPPMKSSARTPAHFYLPRREVVSSCLRTPQHFQKRVQPCRAPPHMYQDPAK